MSPAISVTFGAPFSGPGDFSAWYEVFLDGRWWTMDARHNDSRMGRVLMAVGRDATDVAITTSFGDCGPEEVLRRKL